MSRDTSSMGNILQGYIDSESRVDRMRKLNRLKTVKDEESREEAMALAEIERRNYQKALDREHNMAAELEQMKTTQLREEKRVQLVREQAPEIRELERKLHTAYMNKERSVQVEEGKERDAVEKETAMKYHYEMDALRQKADEAQHEQDQIRRETLSHQKSVLEQQMRDRDMARLAAYQQFLEEKRNVDAVVAKIQNEDVKEKEEKLRKQQMTQQYIENYLKERESFKQEEDERRKEEDRKIVEYMKEQSRRKEENLRTAKEKEALQQQRLDAQSKAIQAERQRKEEMEALIADYHMELVEKKERDRAREEMEKNIRSRLVMLQANEYQKELKMIKKEAEAEEELEFRRRMMEKFAEDDRIEQMKQADRNRKRAEHNREVQRLIEERKKQRELERQSELAAAKQATEKEAEIQDVIRQERLKLLREHAVKLKDFLPKGVFTEDDLRALGVSSINDL
eukprot:TRINITY_DN594_c0_g6_i1.p1 TRINITY_DN594_c0_g6~~TRINITY_DN594_c0_g6_i1.p1  ORF type:complete len:456 (+),score=225.06 TRINITY_DN594_c0_g6_i1:44-1411(+)